MPVHSSSLWISDTEPVRLPPDPNPWGEQGLMDSYADPTNPYCRFMKEHVCGRGPMVMVDVGAFVGLFSRMALLAVPGIDHVYAYEPHGYYFEYARANLAPWADKIRLHNAAIGNDHRPFSLYCDASNPGNQSVLPHAMGKGPSYTMEAYMLDGSREVPTWTSQRLPVFYKSDCQGWDETVAAAIGMPFFRNHVPCALFELWRIAKEPAPPAFREILDSYPFKRMLTIPDNRGRDVSTDQVFEWLESNGGNDFKADDLAVWR